MSKTKIYFWLKIDKQFFNNLFIKRLKNVAGGNTMLVIYIRLMLESLDEDCVIFYEGQLENLTAELALKLDVSEEDMMMTIEYFAKCGVIQIDSCNNAEFLQAKSLVAQETNHAKYMRERRQINNVNQEVNNVKQVLTSVNQSKSKSKSKSKNKEIEKESFSQLSLLQELESITGRMFSPTEIEEANKMFADINEAMVIEAFKRAKLQGKTSFAYVKGIIRNWKEDGFTTVEQVKAEKKKERQEEVSKYGW